MHPFLALLAANKKSKGANSKEVLAAIADLEDPNLTWDSIEGSGQQSALGAAIAFAPNEAQAAEFGQALLDRGAQAADAQVPGQVHNKAINQAIKKSYYKQAFTLIEQGANLDDVVHAWLFRPKNIAQARGQLAMEQALWRHYDGEQRQKHHVAIMASLMACEVLCGGKVDPDLRQEVVSMARARAMEEDWNHHSYVLSNLDDAAKALRNPTKALDRISQVVSDWFDGMLAEQLEPNHHTRRYNHIPDEFWGAVPALQAQRCAGELEHQTPASVGRAKRARI